MADEPGEVGGVCGAGTLFRIARSHHSLGLYRLISRTAVYGPVRTVVWEGGRCEASSLSRFATNFLLNERKNPHPQTRLVNGDQGAPLQDLLMLV